MRNLKLLIEYDGSNYAGWQRQENGSTIQGKIENVFENILQEKVDVIGAGRTDAGVHAKGQVAHVLTNTRLDVDEIRGGLNALLPDDIVVHDVSEVSMDFHARYSARDRKYSYLITQQPTAIMRNFTWYVKYSLDYSLLTRTAEVVAGKHDFKSFCRADTDVVNYVCSVRVSGWDFNRPYLRYTISADRFLHGMVRALVGTMVDVARGYMTYDEFLSAMGKKDRREAGLSAPARGLTLEQIVYE